jgi:hypothetical protein
MYTTNTERFNRTEREMEAQVQSNQKLRSLHTERDREGMKEIKGEEAREKRRLFFVKKNL